MTFTSFEFVVLFLPCVLVIYFLGKKSVKIQNVVLVIASMFFYSVYDLKYILMLFLCIIVTFFGGYIGWKRCKYIFVKE